MAKLTAAQRNRMPKSEFGEPGKRAYPVDTKARARNAKSRASQAEHEGRMSPAERAKIDAKADRVLKRAEGGMVHETGECRGQGNKHMRAVANLGKRDRDG